MLTPVLSRPDPGCKVALEKLSVAEVALDHRHRTMPGLVYGDRFLDAVQGRAGGKSGQDWVAGKRLRIETSDRRAGLHVLRDGVRRKLCRVMAEPVEGTESISKRMLQPAQSQQPFSRSGILDQHRFLWCLSAYPGER